MKKLYHPFHLVDIRPWPLTRSVRAFFLTRGFVRWFQSGSLVLVRLGLFGVSLSIIQWWRDVRREARLQGLHCAKVAQGMQWGMILFIVSEIMFFFSFFWAFFHSSLTPRIELGTSWPPVGVVPLDPFAVPLLNTIILLSSGVTVTWAHHRLMEKEHKRAVVGLAVTVILGVYFTRVQVAEYFASRFNISDSAYGSTFFVATGFHGFHVLVGASFLLVCLARAARGHFSSDHHFGFEAAAWYWHFVDVVWLFLFCFIYWWGSYRVSINCISDFQSEGFNSINIVLIFVLVSLALRALIGVASYLLGGKVMFSRDKVNEFECGFDPSWGFQMKLSLRFFTIILLFLIFDIEVGLLLPLILERDLKNPRWAQIGFVVSIILLVGVWFEWSAGRLWWKV